MQALAGYSKTVPCEFLLNSLSSQLLGKLAYRPVCGHNGGMLDKTTARQFSGAGGYLNTASMGLGPHDSISAMKQALDDWHAGRSAPGDFDADVDRARRAYARVTNTDQSSVAIVSQVSVASGLVAASLAPGATVLCAEEDFSSVLFPFLADKRLHVRFERLSQLLEHVSADVDLVAVSAVQSADGRVLDLDRLADIADAAGVKTYVDVSQAAGWLPIESDRFDVTAAGAYKWLLSPRGSGFVTVRTGVDWLNPVYAGWYSGSDPWTSLYGPPLRLAEDARRFDVSPAWFDFVGAARSVELLADIGVEAINEHSVGLANRLRERMGLAPSTSAIVSLDTRRGDALAAAGIKASARAGRVRLSFYIYNTVDDVDRAADVLLGE